MPGTYHSYRAALQQLELPCAFVDLDALDANIQAVLQQADGLPVRVATKSIRCRWLLDYLLQAGFKGLMCFSAAEAAWLSTAGFDDLLVAYPSQDRSAVTALCQQVKAGKGIWLMVDSLAQASWLNALAAEARIQLPICLDLDMSSSLPGLHFGVRRSPLRSPEAVKRLAQQVQSNCPHLNISALMGYEAQIAGVGDLQGPYLKAKVIQALQSYSQRRVFARRQASLQQLQALGIALDFVNGGGSGSLRRTRQDSAVTELTAGSACFAPVLFDHYRDLQLQPAAGFALPVVRQPAPDIYTCLGGGYIASGAAGPDRLPQVWLPEGGQLLPLEGAGEVQTPVHFAQAVPLQWGDPILFRHAKAGELCERFKQLHLLRGQQVEQSVPTYRGEGQCFF
ncbi:MAG: amino acid deaminase/aldolase [Candidatus Sericytochromatia bacterium]|nr:amino acid deaminase/aldolase [Candidatus Sericytochromatia bacterium]